MTTIPLPDGFLTRPDAAQSFNRSKRALERDLEKARSSHDEEALGQWRLVTKDGDVREATAVADDEVEELVAKGMVPTWCVSETWLEEKYGRKGSPKPELKTSATETKPSDQTERPTGDSPEDGSGGLESSASTSNEEFFKERIRTLEREKREEAERNERREAKLFAELDVKNKQIAAWDEITQGLMKGLATGQLTPRLLEAYPSQKSDSQNAAEVSTQGDKSEDGERVDVTTAPASKSAQRERGRTGGTTPKRPKTKRAANPKPVKKEPKGVFERHTPTFHKALSGILRRS